MEHHYQGVGMHKYVENDAGTRSLQVLPDLQAVLLPDHDVTNIRIKCLDITQHTDNLLLI